jgi:uncharacterized protein YbjT (DUF2867 family)
MTNALQTRTVFVAGGTGKTGSRVAARLQARGTRVRVGSRRGVEPFDWSRPDTWAAAIGHSDAAYIAYSPDLALPGAADQIGEFTGIARAQGVQRFVLLSGRGEPEAQAAEQAVLEVAPESTVLRSSWMDQNFSEGNFLDLVLSGDVTLPVGLVGEPFVDIEDIAEAAVTSLLQPGHEGRIYEVTGPRLLTFADAVAEIAAATGRQITFSTVPLDAFAEVLADIGTPEEAITLVRYLFGELFDGRNASLGTGIQECLGRAPRDFRTFAHDAAASGVWNA